MTQKERVVFARVGNSLQVQKSGNGGSVGCQTVGRIRVGGW